MLAGRDAEHSGFLCKGEWMLASGASCVLSSLYTFSYRRLPAVPRAKVFSLSF